jgi:hypothetical protein
MSKGIVYIVRNPAFTHLIKIGQTTKSCVEDRRLNASNVPEDYEVLYAYKCDNIEEIETYLHGLFEVYRHYTMTGRKTEFFYIGCLADAKVSLEMLTKARSGVKDATEEVQENIENQQEAEGDYDDTKAIKLRTNRIRFDFLQIPVGAELSFTGDPSKKCITKDETNKVEYKGEAYSISALALKFKREAGKNWPSARGICYFTYEGERLIERYSRLQEE